MSQPAHLLFGHRRRPWYTLLARPPALPSAFDSIQKQDQLAIYVSSSPRKSSNSPSRPSVPRQFCEYNCGCANVIIIIIRCKGKGHSDRNGGGVALSGGAPSGATIRTNPPVVYVYLCNVVHV